MTGVGVVGRTNNRQLVHNLCLQRQMLADFDARHLCRDRLELAPNIRRCVRFQIVHADVTRTAGQPNEDDRFLGNRFSCILRSGLLSEQVRQGQPANPQAADPNKIATTNTFTVHLA